MECCDLQHSDFLLFLWQIRCRVDQFSVSGNGEVQVCAKSGFAQRGVPHCADHVACAYLVAHLHKSLRMQTGIGGDIAA